MGQIIVRARLDPQTIGIKEGKLGDQLLQFHSKSIEEIIPDVQFAVDKDESEGLDFHLLSNREVLALILVVESIKAKLTETMQTRVDVERLTI